MSHLKSEQERLASLLENAWLGLGDTSGIDILSPFDLRTREDIENPILHTLKLMRNPMYFPFTCKHIFNIELLPMQNVVLQELWNKPFPMWIGSRGMGKSFLMALYAMLRALLCPGVKIVIVGAAFRQAKVVFEYCEYIWSNAPVLRDLVGSDRGRNNRENGPRRDIDRCELIIGDSIIIALPLGDGKKIRGQRANYIIADEFASIPEEVYENVVAGFAAVSASPIQQVKNTARTNILKGLGLWSNEQEEEAVKSHRGNQAILSGTAYYDFNHFSKYWKRYKAIIESRGDKHKLEEIFQGEVPPNFNWRDYSVIRVPVELLPEGFMDAKHVARSKATVHNGIYLMEFGAVFATDSEGFFRRSLIESCVVGKTAAPMVIDGHEVVFEASLRGNPRKEYVYGIDPASEQDNFSIVVIEMADGHRRIVYCWTTTRQSHKEKVKAGLIRDLDFYGYCARKIRDLMKTFPCVRMVMDSQGGGIAVEEALHDPDKFHGGEKPIWQVIDPDDHKDSDDQPGLHILEMVQFARADWVSEANHGMRKDFEDKVLLFPHFDPLSIGLAIEEDKASQRLYDTLEDCVMEIEQLKDELATIIHTQTVTGRDRWDTPQIKGAGGKTGRLRKDRYSALVMANMTARTMQRSVKPAEVQVIGGFAHTRLGRKGGALYTGPDWFCQGGIQSGSFGQSVRRGGV
ncbi:MAG: terminase family protein [Gemmataceae bacterium]|nr:terminase family protein [Gemmataceae bacterium]